LFEENKTIINPAMIMSMVGERWKRRNVRNVIIFGQLELRLQGNARTVNLGSGASEAIAKAAQQRTFF
jgi:hypothetical protein